MQSAPLPDADERISATAPADPLLVRANKLDLLERLADDLAHEIKNPLHSMVINLEVLRRRLERLSALPGAEGGDAERYVAVLGGELERVTRRIDLLLRLSRPGRGAEGAQLSDLVEELMELLQLEARHHNATLVWEPGLRPARVHVPRDPARQLILNLVLEALEACAGGGTLRLETRVEDGRAQLVVTADGGAPRPAGDEGSARRAEASRVLAAELGADVQGGPVGGGRSVVVSLPARGG